MFCFEFVFQASHKKRQQHRHRHNETNWKFPSTETWFQESATARSQSAHSLPCFLTIRNQKQHASMDTRILIFNLIQNLKISGECRSSFPVCSQFEKDSASRWCLGRWEVTNSFWRSDHRPFIYLIESLKEVITIEKMNSEITFYRSASRLEEERLKAVQELEEVNKEVP